MNSLKLSNELRRFIHSIASIPHLEAMLLLRQSAGQEWNLDSLAQRLYLNNEKAAHMLHELIASGICAPVPEHPGQFIYAPAQPELEELIDQLALFYANNLIEVTNMIHSRSQAGRMVHLFADAFKFQKDK